MTRRVAILSLHTSPLSQPGEGDSGGMNVYVREMAAALAHSGNECRVYVRRGRGGQADEVPIEPGVTVVHVDAGSPDLGKEELHEVVDRFADGVLADLQRQGDPDVIHANYWLSGVAGHRIKHALEVPLAVTFHTLARVKSATGDAESERRARAETEVIGCADVVIASCEPEAQQLRSFYDAPPERIELAAPGVEHALFSPGDREGARRALGLGSGPVLLFVGRIQPLKRPLVAVETMACLAREDARLLIVGGPSGPEGNNEYQRLRGRIQALGLEDRVTLVPPCPHHWLSTYYRAADVVLVPSRSESFGLVALEAAACGTPVVAAPVGGLRAVVDDGRTGFLVDEAVPENFANRVAALVDNPLLAAEMAMNAAERARSFSWAAMARSLGAVYRRVESRVPVYCQ
ncbi:glycosyltransferase [Candidatus Poriferisocius sp.]|uniref:glycosyltransferase n=1 Tax=Candidatus Poriferisocius sp. TaxID=3101276 RepID=UPI003B02C122